MTNEASEISGCQGTYYPYLSDPFADRTSGLAMTVNFGQNAFKYTVPAGYHAGWYN
jgi:hypothetical protein